MAVNSDSKFRSKVQRQLHLIRIRLDRRLARRLCRAALTYFRGGR